MSEQPSTLSESDRDRIARNRQKALQLKSAKLTSHPYAKAEIDSNGKTIIKVQGSKFLDTGGGFLLEQTNNSEKSEVQVIPEKPVQIPIVYEKCIDCDEKFIESYLMDNFAYSVCDQCRDSEEKHSLITRTEAKTEYLLKDCDFDKREPPLKFILRKNPHNPRWGDMKLYLHLQVEERALEVWGSEEKLMEEREGREEKREKSKHKKFNKNLKKLRMEMRSSLFDRTSASSTHQHKYGEETYDEDDDTYSHYCEECGFKETYEKM